MFPDNETARKWPENNIWPDGRKCPKCGYDDTVSSRGTSMPYRCRGCDKRFSVDRAIIIRSV